MSRLKIFFILCLFFLLQNGFAQEPSVKTSVDKTSIFIGQQFNVTIESATSENGYKVQWLHIPDSIEHFEVIKKTQLFTAEKNGLRNYSQTYTFTSFDSGEFTIPAFRIRFFPVTGGEGYTLFTDSLKINVSYSPPDNVQPYHDIKPVIIVKDEWPLWIWLAIIDAILLLIIIIMLIIKLIKKKKKISSEETSISAYEEAVISLKKLREEDIYKNEKVKLFYTKVTGVFKRYISRNFSKDVHNLTSDELLIYLSGKNLSKEVIAEVANNLRMADAVKFAKFNPDTIQNENILQQTKAIIDEIESKKS